MNLSLSSHSALAIVCGTRGGASKGMFTRVSKTMYKSPEMRLTLGSILWFDNSYKQRQQRLRRMRQMGICTIALFDMWAHSSQSPFRSSLRNRYCCNINFDVLWILTHVGHDLGCDRRVYAIVWLMHQIVRMSTHCKDVDMRNSSNKHPSQNCVLITKKC